MEKTRSIKLKIQGKHMTSTSLLMFSLEFLLERELCNTSVLSSQSLQLKHKIELFAGGLMDVCYIKRNLIQ